MMHMQVIYNYTLTLQMNGKSIKCRAVNLERRRRTELCSVMGERTLSVSRPCTTWPGKWDSTGEQGWEVSKGFSQDIFFDLLTIFFNFQIWPENFSGTGGGKSQRNFPEIYILYMYIVCYLKYNLICWVMKHKLRLRTFHKSFACGDFPSRFYAFTGSQVACGWWDPDLHCAFFHPASSPQLLFWLRQ